MQDSCGWLGTCHLLSELQIVIIQKAAGVATEMCLAGISGAGASPALLSPSEPTAWPWGAVAGLCTLAGEQTVISHCATASWGATGTKHFLEALAVFSGAGAAGGSM